jgi:DhnA family fructose-bisphosphate aldolase class Ia
MGGTGYLSILPVDQGIEHTAGSSFTPNPIYFDPENSIKLAMEGMQCYRFYNGRFSPIFKKMHIRFRL